jgi:hypothetical protein
MSQAKLHRCVEKVKAKGKSMSSAFAICRSRLKGGKRRKKK